MNSLKKIVFRADASPTIGYGHFTRTLALADMLDEGYEKVFATCHPTEYQKKQVAEVCNQLIPLQEENHFEEFLRLLNGNEIVVLDNYFFTTDYQRAIKAKGCKLVCIDDMHDKHYVADVVINHALTDKSLFSVEPYTQLCLGLDYALLRRPFLEANPLEVREKGHCVVAFGGTDWNNLTAKIAKILSVKEDVLKITAIVGDAYQGMEVLKEVEKVQIRKNLSAQQMADLFCSVEFAVLPTSTVCIEAMACGCPVMGGYYVDNQREYYETFTKSKYIESLDNLLETKTLNCKIKNTPKRHFSDRVAPQHTKLFLEL